METTLTPIAHYHPNTSLPPSTPTRVQPDAEQVNHAPPCAPVIHFFWPLTTVQGWEWGKGEGDAGMDAHAPVCTHME